MYWRQSGADLGVFTKNLYLLISKRPRNMVDTQGESTRGMLLECCVWCWLCFSFETNVFGSNKIVTTVLSEVLLVMVLTSPGPFPAMMYPWRWRGCYIAVFALTTWPLHPCSSTVIIFKTVFI